MHFIEVLKVSHLVNFYWGKQSILSRGKGGVYKPKSMLGHAREQGII